MGKNKILTNIIAVIFTGAAAVLPAFNVVLASATVSAVPIVNNEKDIFAEVSGSVVTTNQPEEIASFAKSNGLSVRDVVRMNSKGESLVVLNQQPDHPRVKALAKQKNVSVAPNYVYRSFFTPNDTKYGEQWNMPKISAPSGWDITRGSSDVTIAIIDSGILFTQTINGTAYNQPDFPEERKWTNLAETGMTAIGDNCYNPVAGPEDKRFNNCDDSGNGLIDDWQGWDFMAGYRGNDEGCPNHSDPSTYESPTNTSFLTQDNDPQPYSCDSPTEPSVLNKNHYNGTCVAFDSACFVGHGTMVASAAAAASNNNQLIAGLDHNAKLMNIRILDGYGYGTTARLVSGLHYAAENGADVINLSLGSRCSDESFSDPLVEEALQAAADAGAVIVAASGNGNLSTVCYPASSPFVMAIGATGPDDKRRSYSSYSNKLDVVAPAGVPVANAPSSYINSTYLASAGGTSLSTPHVAGLAALIKGKDPSLSRDDIRKFIRESSDKVAGMEGKTFHPEYGYGRINLYQALWRTIKANTHHPYAWSIESNEVYADEAMTQGFTTTITVPPGEAIFIRLKARNYGYMTWDQAWTRLGTEQPKDRTSLFHDESWIKQNRPAELIEPIVEPGQVGTFEFQLRAPEQTGSYVERFNGVAELRGWFDNSPIAYRIDVVEPAAPSNTEDIALLPGQQLDPGKHLLSPARHSTLALQKNGNLIYRTHFKTVWSSNTAGNAPGRLLMQSDGNLVLYGANGSVVWHSVTHGNNGAWLTTQTNGNLVIYDESNNPLWSTNSVHFPDNLGMVNKTLPMGVFYQGQMLQTADRRFRLVFQKDGNLVLYSPTRAIWAASTVGKGATYLAMQGDGNLVLYDSNGKPVWHTGTNGHNNSRLVIQQDGNLVLYDSFSRPTWHTGTHGAE